MKGCRKGTHLERDHDERSPMPDVFYPPPPGIHLHLPHPALCPRSLAVKAASMASLFSTFCLGLGVRRSGGDQRWEDRGWGICFFFCQKPLYPRPWLRQVTLSLLLPSLGSGTCFLSCPNSPAGGSAPVFQPGASALYLVGFLKSCLRLWQPLCSTFLKLPPFNVPSDSHQDPE